MKLIQLFETQLFEDYKTFKSVYDDALEQLHPRQANDLQAHIDRIVTKASKLNIKKDHPVDIFSFLVKNNQAIINPVSGNKADSEFKDVGFWIRLINKNKSNVLNTLDIFVQLLEKSLDEIKNRVKFKQHKSDYDVIHKGDSYIVFKPYHRAASCRLGANAHWCISSKDDTTSFGNYYRTSDIYIIHTKNEKFSVVVDRTNRELVEVQTSKNNYKEMSVENINDFINELKKEGIDPKELEKILDTSIIIRHFKLIDFHIEDNFNVQQDKTVFRYEFTYIYEYTDNNERFEKRASEKMMTVRFNDGEEYTAFLPHGSDDGNKIIQVLIDNVREYMIPDDLNQLKKDTKLIENSLIEKGIDPKRKIIAIDQMLNIL